MVLAAAHLERSYLAAIAASLLIHAAVISVIGINWSNREPPTRTIVPVNYVQATLMQLQERAPQPPLQEVLQPPQPDLEAERRAEEQRLQELKRQQERDEAERLRELEEQRLAEERRQQELREAEQKRQEELERLEQLAQDELARRAQADELANQGVEQASEEIMSYGSAFRGLIEQNWSRPASARNGMTAVLQVNLVPTGSLVSVTVVQSSGDTAFDRSAAQAVRKAEPFEFVQDMPIAMFEQNFRRFNFEFSPQDLRL